MKAAYRLAIDYMPKHLSNLLGKLEDHGGYYIIRSSGGCLIGPSMINDACPIASALRCRLGGLLIRPVRVVNGQVMGKGTDDLNNIILGYAIHEAYTRLVKEANPDWIILTDIHYNTSIRHNDVVLEVGFSPDILMAKGGEWHLIEVKSGKFNTTHELQLSSYYYLLKDLMNIKAGWLVTMDAIIPYSVKDLEASARQALDYLYAVKRVLDSWTSEEPGFVVKGSCPCRWAVACPVWRGILAFTQA